MREANVHEQSLYFIGADAVSTFTVALAKHLMKGRLVQQQTLQRPRKVTVATKVNLVETRPAGFRGMAQAIERL